MNIPHALAELLNKTEPGWFVFAHMVPTRIFRIIATENFCSFRVEQFSRTNKDNFNPRGTWRTISAHTDQIPGRMCQTACNAAIKTQNDFISKMQKKMERRVDEAIRQRNLG